MRETDTRWWNAQARQSGSVAELFRNHWASSAAVYLPAGKVPAPGTLFANPALAQAYSRVLREATQGATASPRSSGARAWSQGFVAEAIDRFCREEAALDTSGEPHHGVLTGDDMARWHAHVEAPLSYDYGRYTVCKPVHGRKGRSCCSSWRCSRALTLTAPIPRAPISCTFSWNAPSSPTPTGRNSTAIRTAGGADRHAPLRRLQRCAPQARRRRGLA